MRNTRNSELDEEYKELGAEVLGTSDLTEIYGRLRNDPELHFEDGPTIVAASKAALAKAKAAMGDWFGRLPEADCLVSETPSGPLAFYFRPAADGSRPGTFFVNTSDPSGWGRFEIEALAYHEGIPGHHLQLAIAGELQDVPNFRKHAYITAYAEGWGLYTERLADEMGLYSGPLERIGMLSMDSMRAGRLVVDTGMHAHGWSRQQAIDFLASNSPMNVGQITNEVDRYIGWPGQALAYMIGRLEIMRMRQEARDTMGDRFDIKGFHDVVLSSGLMPLPTLDRMVSEWASSSPGWKSMITLYQRDSCEECTEIAKRLRDMVVAHDVITIGDQWPSELSPGPLPTIIENRKVVRGIENVRAFVRALDTYLTEWNRFQSDTCYVDEHGNVCDIPVPDLTDARPVDATPADSSRG